MIPPEIRKIYIQKGMVFVSFKYRQDLIDRIRKVPKREYYADTKEWGFPVAHLKDFIDLFPDVHVDPKIILQMKRLNNPKDNLVEMPVINTFSGVLYPFQKVGVRFLITGKKVLLCDDMGTGKTVMGIAASCALLESGDIDKVIIICPSSLKFQWEKEISRFTKGRSVLKISGRTKDDRLKIWRTSLNYDFIILNYELVINKLDSSYITELNRRYNLAIILDEATRIKSHRAKTSKAMKRLDAPVKFLLTGTPVENTPAELYSLNEFLDNERLGKWYDFDSSYIRRDAHGWIVGFKNLDVLHDKIKGIMLRRKKEEVLPDLPEKIIQEYDVEMSEKEFNDYDQILDVVLEHLGAVDKAEAEGNEDEFELHMRAAFQSIVFCKMYCDHPDLLRQSKSEQIKNFSIKATESSKLNELKNIVEEIVSSGNKVIIFTQYVKMMEIIEREIPDVLLYYGGMSEKQRNEAIRLFTETNDYFVLCSTDAGAHGLNLQNAASYMINYDLPWNPSKLNQRIDRIHRMGQSNVVNIINLVISNYTTIEERVVKILNKKQRMFEKLIEGE